MQHQHLMDHLEEVKLFTNHLNYNDRKQDQQMHQLLPQDKYLNEFNKDHKDKLLILVYHYRQHFS